MTPYRFFGLMAAVALAFASIQPIQAAPHGDDGRGRFTDRGVSSVLLLSSARVQSELQLNAEQRALAGRLYARLRRGLDSLPGAESPRENVSNGHKQLRNRLEKLDREMRTGIDALLNETQRRRLRQISLRTNLEAALADQDVARSLALSAEQRAALEQVRRQDLRHRRELTQRLRGASKYERRENLARLNKARDAQALAVLTAAQRSKFDHMLGPRIETDSSFPRGHK